MSQPGSSESSHPRAKSAFACLDSSGVCLICGSNPCHGHSQPEFLAGLVAAGVFYATPGTRRQQLPRDGVHPRMHLRPLD